MTSSAAALHDGEAIRFPGRTAPLDITFFVSCYNERDFIIDTIETIRAALAVSPDLKFEIIVIDDVSKDGSADVVESYIRSHPDVRILLKRNRVNQGLAQNYVDAAFIGK